MGRGRDQPNVAGFGRVTVTSAAAASDTVYAYSSAGRLDLGRLTGARFDPADRAALAARATDGWRWFADHDRPGGSVGRSPERPAAGRGESRRRCALSVSDDGPEIAADRVAGLFEAFRRRETHGRPGVGLGLTIAARAATLLGAELSVGSAVGKGSTFAVAFPPAAARPPKAVR
ncbi:MAG: histidine kinase [Phycisphaerales bacterium]|nr:histidine kinase [Phycisphaerales bacterium]